MRNVSRRLPVAKFGPNLEGDFRQIGPQRDGSGGIGGPRAEFAALRLASTISTGHALGSGACRVRTLQRLLHVVHVLVRRQSAGTIGRRDSWNQRGVLPAAELQAHTRLGHRARSMRASIRTGVSSVRCKLSCGLLWRELSWTRVVNSRSVPENRSRPADRLADRRDFLFVLDHLTRYMGNLQANV